MDCCHLDTIFESNPHNHLGQVIKSAQASPLLLGALTELEHHVQHMLKAIFAPESEMPTGMLAREAFDWVCNQIAAQFR
jgi:hypothetical protein